MGDAGTSQHLLRRSRCPNQRDQLPALRRRELPTPIFEWQKSHRLLVTAPLAQARWCRLTNAGFGCFAGQRRRWPHPPAAPGVFSRPTINVSEVHPLDELWHRATGGSSMSPLHHSATWGTPGGSKTDNSSCVPRELWAKRNVTIDMIVSECQQTWLDKLLYL
jgi:hypothetical protein